MIKWLPIDANRAWIVSQLVLDGRSARDVADELGVHETVIWLHVKLFLETYYEPLDEYDHCKRALNRYLRDYGDAISPIPQKPKPKPKRRYTTSHPDPQYAWARYEHAFLLRAEGLKWKEVGRHLDVSHHRATQLSRKFARKLSASMRHSRLTITFND